MESNQFDGILIEVKTQEGEPYYETDRADSAVASFLWLKPPVNPHRLFINGLEFPAKNLQSDHILGYPYKLHQEVLDHINYCIELYIAFYQD